MRRFKLFAAALAISGTGVVGAFAAPASATTVIGTKPGVLVSLCLTVRPATSPALCIYI